MSSLYINKSSLCNVSVKNSRYSFVAMGDIVRTIISLNIYSNNILSSLKVKIFSPYISQFFYFKFELVAYREDFFKIVLLIKKPDLAIVLAICLFFLEKKYFLKKYSKVHDVCFFF